MLRIFTAISLLLLLSMESAMALEEPAYKVVATLNDFEIRDYEPYVIAEVDIAAADDDGAGDAFRILAGYIFGDNRAATKMAMTAPVESRRSGRGEKMAMTAPVTSNRTDDGQVTTYAFVMESRYTTETLPVPNDERIQIREVPARTMAVIRYAGRWTQKKYLKYEAKLRSALAAAGLETVGRPIFARYNSPFSLPMIRRNEIMLQLADPTDGVRYQALVSETADGVRYQGLVSDTEG